MQTRSKYSLNEERLPENNETKNIIRQMRVFDFHQERNHCTTNFVTFTTFNVESKSVEIQ